MKKIIVLTEMGAAAYRKMGQSSSAGDLYSGKPSKSVLKKYIRHGFICEAIVVEEQGCGVFCDDDGTYYTRRENEKIVSASGEAFEVASMDEFGKVIALKAV